MITHDEVIFCILQEYPGAVHGRDFLVGQKICEDTGVQLEDASVRQWKLDAPFPSRRTMQAMLRKHGAAAQRFLIERTVRHDRERRLKEADTLVYKAMDAGDMEKMRLAGTYRQALRDVPELPGFPESFDWPAVPDGLVGAPSGNT